MHFFTFILKNLLRRPARSLLTIVGLAVAICAVVSLVGVATGFEQSFMEVYTQRGIDLVVQRAGGSDNLNNTLPEQLLDRIAELPGVEQVMGGAVDLVSFQKYGIIGRLINGWPPDSPLLKRITVTSGRQLTAGDTRKAAIGRVLATNLKKKVGDTIDLFEEPFTIVGIYESPIVFENAGVVVLQEELQRLQHRPNEVAGFTVTAKRPIDDAGMENLRTRIEALQPGLEVKRSSDFVEHVPQVRISRAVAWLTSAIALFIGAIGMLNTMVMSVFERTKEIGTLRAIGWRKSRIVRMVIGESLLLSIAGAALEAPAAQALAKFLSHMPNTAGVTQGTVEPSVFVEGLLVALIVGLLGSVYPALWSANLMPTEALRR